MARNTYETTSLRTGEPMKLNYAFLLAIPAALHAPAILAGETMEGNTLKDAGYSQTAPGLWERYDLDGSVSRVGDGQLAQDEFKNALASLRESMSKSLSIQKFLALQDTLNYIENLAISSDSTLKSSGNNGCTTGTSSVSATVNPGTRTANAGVSGGGFGPVDPNNVQMKAAIAVASPGASGPEFDFDASISSAILATASASATGTGGTSCYLYGFSVTKNFLTSCMKWTDASYAGSC